VSRDGQTQRPENASDLLRGLAGIVTPVEGAGEAGTARLAAPSPGTSRVQLSAIVAVIAVEAVGAWRAT